MPWNGHTPIPKGLPYGYSQCYRCGAEHHPDDVHLHYGEKGCALCRPTLAEQEPPEAPSEACEHCRCDRCQCDYLYDRGHPDR